MTTDAIIMMVAFLLVIWGGLAASAIHLARTPDNSDENDAE